MRDHPGRSAEGEVQLSVVIPTHNRSGILRTTLEHLSANSPGCPWEIVIVANACSDATLSVAEEMAVASVVSVRVVEEARPSASVARNRGAGSAAGGLLVFLDDDILLRPDGLTRIWEWYDGSDQRALLVGQVLPLPEHLATPFGAFRYRALGGASHQTVPEDVDWFASGLAAVAAEAFRELGGYDETYPAAGLEDADFAIRARRAGHQITFHPGVVGIHNDWAGMTARDYCRRSAVHCTTAPLLAERFPDNDHPWARLIEVNRPPQASDPAALRRRKLLKLAALAVGTDRWLPVIADRAPLPRRQRELVYTASVSLAMFAGYQTGLKRREGTSLPPAQEDSAPSTTLSIVIVTFNSCDEVERSLASLQRHPPSVSHEITVIDNASDDGTVALLRAQFPNATIITLDENIGYGAAINRGVKETDGEYLLLLNPDTEVSAGAIDAMLRLAQTTPGVGIVGPKLVLADGVSQPSARRFPSPWRQWFEALRLHLLLSTEARSRMLAGTYSAQDELGRVDWVSGACHLVPRAVWEQLGGLTERTFCGFDDLDYCWRAHDAGFDTWFCPEAVILHHCGLSVNRRWSSSEIDRLAIHNIYVVLGSHWRRLRVRLYCAAELAGTVSDLALGPRRRALRGGDATAYRAAARQRVDLLAGLLLGRVRPIERYEPGGPRASTRRTGQPGVGAATGASGGRSPQPLDG